MNHFQLSFNISNPPDLVHLHSLTTKHIETTLKLHQNYFLSQANVQNYIQTASDQTYIPTSSSLHSISTSNLHQNYIHSTFNFQHPTKHHPSSNNIQSTSKLYKDIITNFITIKPHRAMIYTNYTQTIIYIRLSS